MLCPRCGANNPQESAFCGACGAPLASAPAAATEQAASIPSAQSSSPAATPSREDAPILRSGPQEQEQPASPQSLEDAPTLRAAPESASAPVPQTPPPAEYGGAGAYAPGAQANPAYPAAPSAYPSGGAYPAVPGSPSGAYPPTVGSGTEYPAGAYPVPGAVYDATTPVPSEVYPGQPTPSQPNWGSYPGQPTPSQPNWGAQQQVSGAYPAQPGPSQPNWGAVQQTSGIYPGQPAPSQPSWGGYPGQPGPAPVKEASRLIQPLPLWVFLISILVVAALLAVLVFFTGADWAAGAQTAGVVALVVGALILIAFGVRAALGLLAQTNPHRRSQVISALLLALILFAVAAIGLTQQSGIHNVQARFLEGQQKWQTAIDEFKSGGQNAPTSDDIARTYAEWGEQLTGQQQYSSAIDKFTTVISNYGQAATEVARAKKDAISAFQSWGAQDAQKQNYAGAVQHYDTLLTQSYCDSPCQSQTGTSDATAYYHLAEQALSAQKFSDSAAAFNQLTTHFASSPEAQRAHADYAKALWGEGQQQLTSTCSTAVTTYQQLSTNFSDTPEGQQAATALKQPQPVKGHFTSTIPSGSSAPGVGLVQGISTGMSSNAFYAILAKSPTEPVHSDGTFTFPSIALGSYYLVWGVVNSADNREVFLVGQRYPATVGPLCAFNFGDISESFPTA